MGQNQHAIFQQGEPLSNYDIIQKVPQHNISYLKHKTTNKDFLIREFAINDKTEFTQTCQKIKNRKKILSPHLTKLQRYSEQMEDNLCSSFYKIFAMWEYPTHTLSDQINERTLKKRRFQQNQIFSIAASIIQGMSCLQASGIKHECLTTSSILFDQTGTVIVADPLTSIYPSNFDRINTNRKTKNVYISPEQCQSLKNQRPIPNRNPYKSDVFILGLILLECGLLEKIDTVFVQDYQEIDLQEVQNKLSQFSKHYSQDLKLTVQTILTRDPKQRMDWLGLRQYIPQKKTNDINKPASSTEQRSQAKSTGYQAFNKLTLGGNKFQSLPNVYNNKEPLNQFTRYDQNYGAGKLLSQRNNLNQTFANPVQSIAYQPTTYNYTTQNLPFFTSNNYPAPTPNTYTPFPTNHYSQKVSQYVFQGKMGSQRPTVQMSAVNVNNISKLTPTIGGGGTIIDRDSSSFPLNSNFQFKKDYLNNPNGFGNFTGLDYQPINNFSTYKTTYPSYSPNYNLQPTSGYVPLSTQGVNKIEPNPNKQMFYNNELKTQINSQGQGSPFLATHVKDAKSITYDKNLFGSYMGDQKSHLHTLQNGDGQHQHYSAIVVTSQNQQGYSPNNIYQPITKARGVGSQDISAPKISSNPILYQPLSGPNSVIKQKPHTNQPKLSTQETYQPKIKQTLNPNYLKQSPYNHESQINQQTSNSPNVPIYTSHQKEQNYQQNPQLQYVIEHFRQGSRYEGTKYQDMRHGQGKFYYQDGGMYQGNWRLNKMDGYGKLYYQSGKIAYEGSWNEDQFQGFGKLYNQDPDELQQMFDYQNFDLIDEYWVHYEGNFVADEKDGEGKMTFSNGEHFVGSFHKDMVEGPGEFRRMNGQVIKGVWNQNQMIEQEQ